MITITGTDPFSANRGVAAMCMATLDIIKKTFPNEKVMLYFSIPDSLHYSSLFNKKYTGDNKIEIIMRDKNKYMHILKLIIRFWMILMWNLLNYFNVNITKFLYQDRILRTYLKSNVIISLNWGDDFTDIYGIIRSIIWSHEYAIRALLKRKTILFPQTIGPFNNSITYFIAKFILQRTTLIMVREEFSYKYLTVNMGLDKNKVLLIPDTAFILEGISSEEIGNILNDEMVNFGPSTIGISLRDLFKEKCVDMSTFNQYLDSMCKAIDYFIENYNVNIILIPHSGITDERYTTKNITSYIIEKINNKDRVHSINKREYTVEELKGIIGKCDLFIGAYMHANISSISMCVPTIGLSYSYKFDGIFKMLGQERYVCNLNDITFENLISTVDEGWANRNQIKMELTSRMTEIKNEIMFSGEILKKVIEDY